MKLKLSNGLDYGEDANGKRVCRGALMGRPDNIPECVRFLSSVKLRLERLKMYDGDCYDAGGCYWGSGNGTTSMYCAWGKYGVSFALVQVFVRSSNRNDARVAVRDILPNARFYR